MSAGYAFFDLDHTLLPHDTQALFCNFVLRREGWRRIFLAWFLPCLPLAALRILDRRLMKRVFFSFLWGMEREKLAHYVDEFVATDFDAALHPEVVAEIERNREEGRRLVLNSASPTFYLEAVAAKLGFGDFVGSEMEIGERVAFLPRVVGPNNRREAKIAAMVERGIVPGDVEMLADSWAYSDSVADRPLLSLAEHGVMIHPDRKLEAMGLERGWRALTPPRPYETKWGDRIATLRQILGCYRVEKNRD